VNDQLVVELAKNPQVKVYGLVASSTQEQRDQAKRSNIELVHAKKMIGFSEKDLLAYPPDSLDIDILIIHSYGYDLGRQAQVIKETKKCKWVHVVHTISVELENFMEKVSASRTGQEISEHDVQLQLCQEADIVIAIGPKVAEYYRSALFFCGKDVIDLTPEIVHDLIDVRPMRDDGEVFRVLINATYHAKYFKVKGCDIAAKAITLLQDMSYYLIFIVLPTENTEELKTRLKEDIKLSQFTVQHFSKSTETWKRLLCQVDLVILPSRTEGFGTTSLCCMSADLPVVISGNSGLGIALKKLPSGGKHVLDSEDPQDWAEKIKEVREKGARNRSFEAKQLKKEYMEKFSWKEQCDKLVEKMISMFPSKQGGKKECVEHTEETVEVKSLYCESRVQQGKLENAPEPEKDIDDVKKGIQEISLTDTSRDALHVPLEQEEEFDVTKKSVEETGPTNKNLDSVSEQNIICDMVDAGIGPLKSSRLLTYVSDIPYSIYSKVCLKLNIKDELFYKDFRLLSEKMGYCKDVTRNLEQRVNPTDVLLRMWCKSNCQATVGRLIELLQDDEMERMDVVEILEKWVHKESSK